MKYYFVNKDFEHPGEIENLIHSLIPFKVPRVYFEGFVYEEGRQNWIDAQNLGIHVYKGSKILSLYLTIHLF